MNLSIINTALQNVAKLINMVRDNVTGYYSDRSLSETTKLTRVEPLVIVSKDCLNLAYMSDITNALLSIFTAHYLQAVAILTRINDVEVVRLLDRLNPDRDETGFILGANHTQGLTNPTRIGNEAYGTLVLENYQYKLPTAHGLALENDGDNAKAINEIANLSVGKLVNVEICVSEDKTIKLPINIRLIVSMLANSTISQILVHKTEDTSLVERYHAWRSGRIGFIKDLIFCQDLIDETKKTAIDDNTGTMQEILRRVTNAKKYGLLTQNPSLVSASNIFVISEEIAKELESKLGGKLSNPHVRQKAFDNTYAMILAVVDREYERVMFYTRGISAGSDLSIKEIKAASKSKSGPDIADILRSMQLGAPLSF